MKNKTYFNSQGKFRTHCKFDVKIGNIQNSFSKMDNSQLEMTLMLNEYRLLGKQMAH